LYKDNIIYAKVSHKVKEPIDHSMIQERLKNSKSNSLLDIKNTTQCFFTSNLRLDSTTINLPNFKHYSLSKDRDNEIKYLGFVKARERERDLKDLRDLRDKERLEKEAKDLNSNLNQSALSNDMSMKINNPDSLQVSVKNFDFDNHMNSSNNNSMLRRTTSLDFLKNKNDKSNSIKALEKLNSEFKAKFNITNMTNYNPKMINPFAQTQKGFNFNNNSHNQNLLLKDNDELFPGLLKNQELKKYVGNNIITNNNNNDVKFSSTFAFTNPALQATKFSSNAGFNNINFNNNTSYEKRNMLPNLKNIDSNENQHTKFPIKINNLFRNSGLIKNKTVRNLESNLLKDSGLTLNGFNKNRENRENKEFDGLKSSRDNFIKSNNNFNIKSNTSYNSYDNFNKNKSKSILLSTVSKKLGLSTEPKLSSDPLNPNINPTMMRTVSTNYERTSFMNIQPSDKNDLTKKDTFNKTIEIFTNDNLVNFLKLPSRKEPDPIKTKNQLAYREANIKVFNEVRKAIKMFLLNKYDTLVEEKIGGDFIYVYKYLQSAPEFPIHKLHIKFLFYAYLSTVMHDSLEKLRLDINFLYSKTFYVFLHKILEFLKNLRKKHTYTFLQNYINQVNSESKSNKDDHNEVVIHEFLYKYFVFFGRVDLEAIYANVIMQSFAIEDEAVRHEQYFNVHKTMYMIITKNFSLFDKIGYLKKLLSLLLPSNRFYIEEVLNFQKHFECDKLTLLTITQVAIMSIGELKAERVLKIGIFFDKVVNYIQAEQHLV